MGCQFARTTLLLASTAMSACLLSGEVLAARIPAVSSQILDAQKAEAERLVAEATALRAKGTAESLQQSAVAFQKAVDLWRAIGDRIELAATLRTLGLVHRSLGKMREAIDEGTEAATLLEGSEGPHAVALADLAGTYFVAGDSHRSIALFEEALIGLRSAGDSVAEAKTLGNLGTPLMNIGDVRRALDVYAESLGKLEPGDVYSRALTLSNMGSANGNIGEIQKANAYLEQALALRRQIGDKRGAGQTLYLLGNIAQSFGDVQTALEYLRESITLRRATGDRPGEAFTAQTMGSAYERLGESQTALNWFEQARQIRHDIGNRDAEAETLTHMAGTYERLGQRATALEYGDRAMRMMRERKNRRGEAEALVLLGEISNAGHEPQRAIGYFDEALPFMEESYPSGEARARGGRATATIDLGRAAESLADLDRALEIAELTGDRFSEVEWRYQAGRAQAAMGRLADAQTSLDRAVSTAENIRTTLPSPEFRARYFATAHKAYDLLIDVLLRQDQVTPERGLRLTAFEVAERARARSLLDLLNESHVDLREGLDADLLARERTLESSLAAKIQYAAGGQGPSKSDAEVALTRREIDALIGALRDVESEIRAKSPRAAALTQPSTATVADVQRDLLDDETALVEYALGDERSFVWTVTRSSVDVRQLPSRGDLEKAVRRAYGDVSVNDLSTNGSLDRSLKELSALLVGPVRSVAVHRVAIVADGALEYLPFAALPGRAGAPLLADYEVVMLPSVSTLAELRRNEAGRTYAPKLIAAIADPVFDAHDVRVVSGQTNGSAAASDATGPRVGTDVRRSAAEAGVSGLDRLPYSRQEVDVIDTLVPSADRLTALDFDANRGLMLGDSLRNYRIVHIATHGLINSQHPELSGLVLSLVDRSGRPQNGFVQSYELYKTKLDADLVVLSACQTALGEEIRGEGLVSLTRPFMYAGVPRVVASLWQVPDRATAELMTRFYTGLVRDHLSASAALRRAQLALRKNPRWSRPYFWAGFTLQGDWR